jgi:hypothetical protein
VNHGSPGRTQKNTPCPAGERPSEPILGSSDDAAPTSPPVMRVKTSTICVGSSLCGMGGAWTSDGDGGWGRRVSKGEVWRCA